MIEATQLIERLRNHYRLDIVDFDVYIEAADLIEQQAARIAELEARLGTLENDAQLGSYVRRMHGSLGRQPEALWQHIEHAIQEQKQ